MWTQTILDLFVEPRKQHLLSIFYDETKKTKQNKTRKKYNGTKRMCVMNKKNFLVFHFFFNSEKKNIKIKTKTKRN